MAKVSIQTDAPEEHRWLTELHSDTVRLKEEIRCAFRRQRHALNSREISLLDQVDNIKEATTSMLITQHVAMTTVKSKLEECARYLTLYEEQGNERGVQSVAAMMKDLKIQEKACQSQLVVPCSQVQFVHDSNELKKSILSYGKLETELEDTNSEHSWDLVQEKEMCESVVDYEIKECQSTQCCKEVKEIEDMQFDCVQSADDFAFENVDLSEVCKANELCSTISECVCDSPCLSKHAIKDHDRKMSKLGLSKMSDGDSWVESRLSKFDRPCYAAQDNEEDILHQVVNSVNQILTPHTNDLSASNAKATGNCDYIDHLQLKLKHILDCTETIASTSNVMESEKLAEVMDDSEAKNTECLSTGDLSPIGNLHNKLQSIFDQTGDSISSLLSENLFDKNFTSSMKSYNCEEPSLIDNLNGRLQGILDGSIDADVDFCKSEEFSKEVRHDKMSPCNFTEDAFLNILHGKLHGILENNVASNEKVDDMSERPQLMKQDPVTDLHMRIVHILGNGNALSSEDANVSVHENDECLDPMSMISNQMQSLMSG